MSATPKLSVAVCTRNRPDDLRACVASILGSPRPDFELVVIDQSDAPSGSLCDTHAGDVRLRYQPTASRGLSRARNEALAAMQGELVAFTDDDCRVASSFVDDVLGYFAGRPDVSMAFGAVTAPAELHEKGHVATFPADERTYRGAFPSPMEPWGIGANMAFRREAWQRAGGFDPELGAGSGIPAGEELDFTIRVLGAGLAVATTPAFSVTHLGVREHEAARKLFLGYIEGAGAAYVKNVRLGTRGANRLYLEWLVGIHREVGRALLARRRPLGIGLVLSGLRGGLRVLRRPLDRRARTLGSA